MEYQRILLVIVVLFIVGLAVVLLSLDLEYPQHPLCDEIENLTTKTLCLALASGDANLCYSIGDEHKKDNCFAHMAIRTKNPELCSQLDGSFCYVEVATLLSNAEICDEIDSVYVKDKCYYGVAVNTSNSILCTNISDSIDLIQCLAISEGDPERCNDILDITGYDPPYTNLTRKRNDCIDEYVEHFNLPEVCELITDTSTKKECKDLCYFRLARDTDEPQFCEQIQDQEEKELCYYILAMETTEPQLCEYVQDPETKERCLIYASLNLSGCYLLEEPEYCIYIIAVDSENASACLTLEEGLQWGCIPLVAESSCDISLCELFSDAVARDDCQRYVLLWASCDIFSS